MTESNPTSNPASRGPFTVWLDALNQSAEHMIATTGRASTPEGASVMDPAAEASACVDGARKLSDELSAWWMKVMGVTPTPGDPFGSRIEMPPENKDGPLGTPRIWTATVKVTVAERPLTLETKGFRRWGGETAIAIPPEHVTFSIPHESSPTIGSAVVTAGIDTFVVAVAMPLKHSAEIYTGYVTSAEQGPNTPVSDAVMPTWA